MNETAKTINFNGDEFVHAKDMLTKVNTLNNLTKQKEELKANKEEAIGKLFGDTEEDPTDVIEQKLAGISLEDLKTRLSGNVNDLAVRDRIDYFFTNDETGEVLTLQDSESFNMKTEYEFKRGMLEFYAENNYYLDKIDEELKDFDDSIEEMNKEVAEAIDPLKENVLAYANYLESEYAITDDDDYDEKKRKQKILDKARAVKDGYKFTNLFELVDKYPSVIKNALNDFKKPERIRAIGKRYSEKLARHKISFSLIPLLNDDTKESFEYRCLPLSEYPEGLENFFIFFLIRVCSMGLNTDADVTFHSSAHICLSRLLKNDLHEDIASDVRETISAFLLLFDI